MRSKDDVIDEELKNLKIENKAEHAYEDDL